MVVNNILLDEYDEEEAKRVWNGCYIRCIENKCETRCIQTTYVSYEGFEGAYEYIDNVGKKLIDTFTSNSDEERIDKAKNLIDKHGRTSVDLSTGRLYFDDYKAVDLASSDSKDKCKITLEKGGYKGDVYYIENIESPKGSLVICMPTDKIKEFERFTVKDRYSLYDIAHHPKTTSIIKTAFDNFTPIEPEYASDREGAVKGFLEDATGDVYVNPVWLNVEMASVLVGKSDLDSFAYDLVETIAHEEAHRGQLLFGEPLKGGWDAGLAALFGFPSPWGSELDAEGLAHKIADTFTEDETNKVKKWILEELKFTDESKEKLNKVKEAVEKENLFFGGTVDVDARDGKVCWSVHKEELFGKGEEVEEKEKKEIEKIADKYGLEYEEITSGGFYIAKFPALCVVLDEVEADYSEYPPPHEEYY